MAIRQSSRMDSMAYHIGSHTIRVGLAVFEEVASVLYCLLVWIGERFKGVITDEVITCL